MANFLIRGLAMQEKMDIKQRCPVKIYLNRKNNNDARCIKNK